MLIITRKQDETILINGEIEIIITDIGTNKVQVGINAPEDMNIVRGELVEDTYNK